MTERPILFSGPMVRAILDGRKTQTRRVVKPQPAAMTPDMERDLPEAWASGFVPTGCPYGAPGDLLWVRETWGINHSDHITPIPKQRPPIDDEHFVFLATEDDPEIVHEMPWRPSIQMPRWASRITLRITDVRVERLNEISEADAKAEGAPCGGWDEDGEHFYETGAGTYTAGYIGVWERINGRGSWDNNPWVWVVGFERVA